MRPGQSAPSRELRAASGGGYGDTVRSWWCGCWGSLAAAGRRPLIDLFKLNTSKMLTQGLSRNIRSSAATTAAGRLPTASQSASSTRPASPARWIGPGRRSARGCRFDLWRGIQYLPVRRRAALQPEGLLRAHAGHEAAHLTALLHVHMYEFWGGVSDRIVCDNLKVGVAKHSREGEVVLNDACETLGEHYTTAIMPVQVRKLGRERSGSRAISLAERFRPVRALSRPIRRGRASCTFAAFLFPDIEISSRFWEGCCRTQPNVFR